MLKLTFALTFTIYVLYNAYTNNQINNYTGTCVKNDTKTIISKKAFYQKLQRKRRSMHQTIICIVFFFRSQHTACTRILRAYFREIAQWVQSTRYHVIIINADKDMY